MINKKRIKKSHATLIENQARSAKALLEDKQFSFFIEYLNAQKKEIERVILNNTIRDSYKEGVFGGIKHTFFSPKKEQLAEYSGKYKMIDDAIRFLQARVETHREMQENLKTGRLEINENE